jgi:hypothetical protein
MFELGSIAVFEKRGNLRYWAQEPERLKVRKSEDAGEGGANPRAILGLNREALHTA